MPNVSEMPQYELIELLKDAAAELVKREFDGMYGDDGLKLAKAVKESIEIYDSYNENRPIL